MKQRSPRSFKHNNDSQNLILYGLDSALTFLLKSMNSLVLSNSDQYVLQKSWIHPKTLNPLKKKPNFSCLSLDFQLAGNAYLSYYFNTRAFQEQGGKYKKKSKRN